MLQVNARFAAKELLELAEGFLRDGAFSLRVLGTEDGFGFRDVEEV